MKILLINPPDPNNIDINAIKEMFQHLKKTVEVDFMDLSFEDPQYSWDATVQDSVCFGNYDLYGIYALVLTAPSAVKVAEEIKKTSDQAKIFVFGEYPRVSGWKCLFDNKDFDFALIGMDDPATVEELCQKLNDELSYFGIAGLISRGKTFAGNNVAECIQASNLREPKE